MDGFNFVVDCINAEKDVLTSLPNPRIKDLKRKYPRLRKLQLSDEDEMADQLPVHIIVGAADYQRIRSTEPPNSGTILTLTLERNSRCWDGSCVGGLFQKMAWKRNSF